MSGEPRVLGDFVGGGALIAASLPNTGNSGLLQILSIATMTLGAVALATGIVRIAARKTS